VNNRTVKQTVSTPLRLTISSAEESRFSEILQKGFAFNTLIGVSIKTFLCDFMALDHEYIQERISTIFLDGKAVDNIEEAIISEGSTLALSSAMPGLAGATLRRDGLYASLRDSITYKEKASNCRMKEGVIIVKLFNLLIDDIGSVFLQKGIVLKSRELQNFFIKQPDNFWRNCSELTLAGKSIDYENLLAGNRLIQHDEVELTVLIDRCMEYL
jgi:hypothetical protein